MSRHRQLTQCSLLGRCALPYHAADYSQRRRVQPGPAMTGPAASTAEAPQTPEAQPLQEPAAEAGNGPQGKSAGAAVSTSGNDLAGAGIGAHQIMAAAPGCTVHGKTAGHCSTQCCHVPASMTCLQWHQRLWPAVHTNHTVMHCRQSAANHRAATRTAAVPGQGNHCLAPAAAGGGHKGPGSAAAATPGVGWCQQCLQSALHGGG